MPRSRRRNTTVSATWSHRWSYCNKCSIPVVICGQCGNKGCSDAFGQVNGFECDACPSAQEQQMVGL